MSDAEITMADAPDDGDDEAQRRDLTRRRSEEYRSRRRRGAVLVTIELEPRDLAALERLARLAPGDRMPTGRRPPMRNSSPRRRTSRRWATRSGRRGKAPRVMPSPESSANIGAIAQCRDAPRRSELRRHHC
jgi:hypothetical protein